METQCHIIGNKRLSTIQPREILEELQKFPKCVIIRADNTSLDDQLERWGASMSRSNIYRFPNSNESFMCKRIMVDGMSFVMFWASKSMFDIQKYSDQQVQNFISESKVFKSKWKDEEVETFTAASEEQCCIIKEETLSTIQPKQILAELVKFPRCVVVRGSDVSLHGKLHSWQAVMSSGNTYHLPNSDQYFMCKEILVKARMPFCMFWTSSDRHGIPTYSDEQIEQFIAESNVLSTSLSASGLHDEMKAMIRDSLMKQGDERGKMLTVMFNNNGMVPNRATKFAFGTIMESLTSKQDGMNLIGHVKVDQVILWEERGISCMLGIDSLQQAGHVYYCGKWVGADKLPGSDGQCGPGNGPHCTECDEKQKMLENNQAIAVRISGHVPCITIVQLECTKYSSTEDNDTGTKRTRTECSACKKAMRPLYSGISGMAINHC